MKTQAISMPMVNRYQNNSNSVKRDFKNNQNSNFKGDTTYIIMPAKIQAPQENTFGKWLVKNVAAASAFSVAWDLGTNLLAKTKMLDGVKQIPYADMFKKNLPLTVGAFLAISTIFRGVDNLINDD